MMRPERNAVTVVLHFSDPPLPYEAWQADLWECPKCKAQICTGFAPRPIAEHYDKEQMDKVLAASEMLGCRIDCFER